MKLTALLLLLLFGMSALALLYLYPGNGSSLPTAKKLVTRPAMRTGTAIPRLKLKLAGLNSFIREHKYNSTYCFMIDMSQPSGKNRFFVYNLKKDSMEYAGLVTHGNGSITGKDELFFSNEPGSGCTSLGKYRVGKPYQGRFGLAYKLYGLDETNNKAFERFVVLHAHSCVPVSEVYPSFICPSLGCPTVAPAFLTRLARYLDNSAKPILMEIYN